MLKFSVLLISFAALSFAYDFKDSAFNDYLYGELKDADSINDVPTRFRRDVETDKCSHNKNMDCCQSSLDPAEMELLKKAKMECYNEFKGDDNTSLDPFDCDSVKKLKHGLICITDCVAKKFNAYNEKGEILRDVVITHLKKKMDGTSWPAEKAEEIADKCIASAKGGLDDGCNSLPLEVFHCTWKEMVQQCPSDIQINSPKCNKLREKISQNDENFLKLAQFHKVFHMFHKDEA